MASPAAWAHLVNLSAVAFGEEQLILHSYRTLAVYRACSETIDSLLCALSSAQCKMNVTVVDGNLLDQDEDVIVNAWNRNLNPWWLLLPQGVSRAIKK